MALISSVKNVNEETMLSILSKRLSRHILTSRYLNAQYLLQHLKDTKLDYEKAILHGKLGDHERALEILVNNVGNYAMAENYCDDLSIEKNENRSQLLLKLLSIYLSSNTKINEFTALAVDLINKRAEDFDGIKVIYSAYVKAFWSVFFHLYYGFEATQSFVIHFFHQLI